MLIIFPVITLLLLNSILKLSNYGYPTPAFLEYRFNEKDAYIANTQFTRLFFPAEIARVPDPFLFYKEKEADTCRIFVMGGSAAQGVPDTSYSFSRSLQYQLSQLFPKLKFKVINCSITAVNSHVVRYMISGCPAAKDDILVLYMGNNEVVGPYGAGSTFSPHLSNPALIKMSIFLKSTPLGQLVNNFVRAILPKKKQVWRGLEMFLHNRIRKDDPALDKVYDNFKGNLEDIIDNARDKGMSVVLSTVACNLKDSPPFGSLHEPGLTNEKLIQWDSFYKQGIIAEESGDYARAIQLYKEAEKIDGTFADLLFRIAHCRTLVQEPQEAKKYYTLARDYDTLRFRADSTINTIIRQTAQKYGDKVIFVDAVKDFEQTCADQIPDGSLFYEHVHLKFKGNYLLAASFCEKIKSLVTGTITKTAHTGEMPGEDDCAQRLAFTPWDRYVLTVDMLKDYIEKPPYSNQLYHKKRLDDLNEEIESLRDSLNRDAGKESLAMYREAIKYYPDDWRLYKNFARFQSEALKNEFAAGESFRTITELLPYSDIGYSGLAVSLLRLGFLDQAVEYSKKALTVNPNNANTLNNLGVVYSKQQKYTKAEECYRQAIKHRPDYLSPYENLCRILLEQKRFKQTETLCRKGSDVITTSWKLYHYLGKSLFEQEKNKEALKWLNKALELQPGSYEVLELISSIKSGKRQ